MFFLIKCVFNSFHVLSLKLHAGITFFESKVSIFKEIADLGGCTIDMLEIESNSISFVFQNQIGFFDISFLSVKIK